MLLDNFNSLKNDLSSGLQNEIAARRKQYEHYRNRVGVGFIMFGLIVITYGMYADAAPPAGSDFIITEDDIEIITETGDRMITE